MEALAEVEENVDEGVPDFARGVEGTRVVAPAPHDAATASGAVEGAGRASGGALDAAAEAV
jgi:hypothetical protein